MLNSALAFAERYPVFPIRVYLDDNGDWKKRPLVGSLDEATQSEAKISAWWGRWPDARPGFRLRDTGLCIVDVDDVSEFPAEPVCLGPHSHVATPSGGFQLVFAQPPSAISKLPWCPGIEILGMSCWAIGYDFEEWSFPRVAPRAVLPKWFWEPRAADKRPQQKVKGLAPSAPLRSADGLLKALRAMDARDWHGQHDEWLKLMTACRYEGIGCEDFVAWSTTDPHYYADGPIIRRKWKSLKPQHGGALYAALSQRGIKVRQGQKGSPLFVGVSSRQWQGIDWRRRYTRALDKFSRGSTENDLFTAACNVADIILECRKPNPSLATDMLLAICKRNGLTALLGEKVCRAKIVKAFRYVEEKELNQTTGA
jgi:Bifunctional DNA primase/polymerase, N-terminal/Primase C terminal 2 (PriCT-2)